MCNTQSSPTRDTEYTGKDDQVIEMCLAESRNEGTSGRSTNKSRHGYEDVYRTFAAGSMSFP